MVSWSSSVFLPPYTGPLLGKIPNNLLFDQKSKTVRNNKSSVLLSIPTNYEHVQTPEGLYSDLQTQRQVKVRQETQ